MQPFTDSHPYYSRALPSSPISATTNSSSTASVPNHPPSNYQLASDAYLSFPATQYQNLFHHIHTVNPGDPRNWEDPGHSDFSRTNYPPLISEQAYWNEMGGTSYYEPPMGYYQQPYPSNTYVPYEQVQTAVGPIPTTAMNPHQGVQYESPSRPGTRKRTYFFNDDDVTAYQYDQEYDPELYAERFAEDFTSPPIHHSKRQRPATRATRETVINGMSNTPPPPPGFQAKFSPGSQRTRQSEPVTPKSAKSIFSPTLKNSSSLGIDISDLKLAKDDVGTGNPLPGQKIGDDARRTETLGFGFGVKVEQKKSPRVQQANGNENPFSGGNYERLFKESGTKQEKAESKVELKIDQGLEFGKPGFFGPSVGFSSFTFTSRLESVARQEMKNEEPKNESETPSLAKTSDVKKENSKATPLPVKMKEKRSGSLEAKPRLVKKPAERPSSSKKRVVDPEKKVRVKKQTRPATPVENEPSANESVRSKNLTEPMKKSASDATVPAHTSNAQVKNEKQPATALKHDVRQSSLHRSESPSPQSLKQSKGTPANVAVHVLSVQTVSNVELQVEVPANVESVVSSQVDNKVTIASDEAKETVEKPNSNSTPKKSKIPESRIAGKFSSKQKRYPWDSPLLFPKKPITTKSEIRTAEQGNELKFSLEREPLAEIEIKQEEVEVGRFKGNDVNTDRILYETHDKNAYHLESPLPDGRLENNNSPDFEDIPQETEVIDSHNEDIAGNNFEKQEIADQVNQGGDMRTYETVENEFIESEDASAIPNIGRFTPDADDDDIDLNKPVNIPNDQSAREQEQLLADFVSTAAEIAQRCMEDLKECVQAADEAMVRVRDMSKKAKEVIGYLHGFGKIARRK
ncbi:hypothetical protein HK098_003681 [Nowakowskiella sp. JEL0407]|nr:hypothetical protein HK098_003681 [Nowakowskiella sp. JEL0407]